MYQHLYNILDVQQKKTKLTMEQPYMLSIYDNNTMPADAPKVARASAIMVFPPQSRNIPNPA